MVASWSAHMFLPHLKRNARASMAMRQGFKFRSKAVSSRDTMQAPVVAINQPVLKSTTNAEAVVRGAGCSGLLVYLLETG